MNIEQIIFSNYTHIVISFTLLVVWGIALLYCLARIRTYRYATLGIVGVIGILILVGAKLFLHIPKDIWVILPYSTIFLSVKNKIFYFYSQFEQYHYLYEIVFVFLQILLAMAIVSKRKQPQPEEEKTVVVGFSSVVPKKTTGVSKRQVVVTGNSSKIQSTDEDETVATHSSGKYVEKESFEQEKIIRENYEHQYRVLKEYDRIESKIISPLDASTVNPRQVLPSSLLDDTTAVSNENQMIVNDNNDGSKENSVIGRGLFDDDTHQNLFEKTPKILNPIESKLHSPLEENTVKPNFIFTESGNELFKSGITSVVPLQEPSVSLSEILEPNEKKKAQPIPPVRKTLPPIANIHKTRSRPEYPSGIIESEELRKLEDNPNKHNSSEEYLKRLEQSFLEETPLPNQEKKINKGTKK